MTTQLAPLPKYIYLDDSFKAKAIGKICRDLYDECAHRCEVEALDILGNKVNGVKFSNLDRFDFTTVAFSNVNYSTMAHALHRKGIAFRVFAQTNATNVTYYLVVSTKPIISNSDLEQFELLSVPLAIGLIDITNDLVNAIEQGKKFYYIDDPFVKEHFSVFPNRWANHACLKGFEVDL